MSKKKILNIVGILVVIAIIVFCITKILAVGLTHKDGTTTQSTQWGWYQVTDEGEIEYKESGYTGVKHGEYERPEDALSAAKEGIDYDDLKQNGWIFCIEHGYPLPTQAKKEYIYQLSKGTASLNSRFHDAAEASNILGDQTNSTNLTDTEKKALENSNTVGQGIKYNTEESYNVYKNSGYEYWARRLDTSRATITTVSTENGLMDWASGYILANADTSSTEEENVAQLALWKVLNFNPSKDTAIEESSLYKKAKAFENYRKTVTGEGPKLNTDADTEYKYKFNLEGNYLIAGPINIEYGDLEVEYKGEKLKVREIDDVILYGSTATGEMKEITEYEFTDANGNPLTDMAKTADGKDFPKTGTEFYIKVDYGIYQDIKTIDAFEVAIYELDLKASAYRVDNVGVIYTEWKPNNIIYQDCKVPHYYQEMRPNLITGEIIYVPAYELVNNGTHMKGATCNASGACAHMNCSRGATSHTTNWDFSKSILIKQKDNASVPAQKLWLLHKAEMFWKKYKLVILFGPENPPETETPPPPTETPETPSHPTYIDIGGKVWIDDVESKEGSQSGLDGVEGTGTDYPRPNVKVTLYFDNGTEVSVNDVAEYARGIFANPVYTDDNGNYMFYQLPMDKKYYVKFTYDGMMYETTEYLAGGSEGDYKQNPNSTIYENNSKAKEEEQDRRAFNDKFAEISGNGPSSLSGDKTTGKSTSVSVLTYKSKVFEKNFQSRLLTTDNEKDVENNHATGKAKEDFEMSVRTNDNLLYPFQDELTIWSVENKNELEYLRHVNLGLKRREKADFRLAVDIKAGATTIKDKEKVVFYKSNAKMDDLMIDATKQTDDYIKQEISASDYNWRKEYNNIYDGASTGFNVVDDQLNVYVLYRIAVANQSDSTETAGIITEIVDYFDNRLEMVPDKDKNKVSELFTTKGFKVPAGVTSWIAEDNTVVSWTNAGNVGEYNAIKTQGLNLKLDKSGDSKSIYLILKVKNNGDVLYTGLENNKTGIENIAEIASYKVLDKDGNAAGLVDCDSAPYNATPGKKSTYEDDTDNAPMFQLILNWEPRKISGNVWDDGLNGDAIKNNPGVKNVEVELIEYCVGTDGAVRKIEGRPGLKFTNNSVYVNKNDNVRTDENGNYEFYVEGGNYAIKFTYGDMVMLKDGTSKKYNAQDYYAAQPYNALSSMSQYNQDHSKAFATEQDLVTYLQNEQKLEINDLDASKDKAQQNWETSNWSADTSNNQSNAREISSIRAKVIENAVVLTNSNATLLNKLNGTNGLNDEDARKLSGNDNTENPNYTYMEAISDIVIVSSNDLVKTEKVINLGLEERPKASVKLEKKVERIIIKTNDGVTLIDTKDASKLSNLQKLDDIQSTFINMDAISMDGATIDIDYSIRVVNDGNQNENVDYLQNYVYIQDDESVMNTLAEKLSAKFGETIGRTTELPIRANTIYDYVNINLEFRADDNKDEASRVRWEKVYDEDAGLGKVSEGKLGNIDSSWLAGDVKAQLQKDKQKVSKVLKTTDAAQNTLKNLRVGDDVVIPIHLGITLAEDTSEEDNENLNAFTYSNCAEVVEVYSAAGRRDYDTIPGNDVPYKDLATGEIHEDDYSETGTTTITPPLGQERIYYVIAIISATIIIVGIVLIKKKVLKK